MIKRKYILLLLFILANTSLAALAKEEQIASRGSISFEEKTYFTESDLKYLEEQIKNLNSE